MRSRSAYANGVNLLEDPGKYYWKWIAVAVVLLVVYGIERSLRTGALF